MPESRLRTPGFSFTSCNQVLDPLGDVLGTSVQDLPLVAFAIEVSKDFYRSGEAVVRPACKQVVRGLHLGKVLQELTLASAG